MPRPKSKKPKKSITFNLDIDFCESLDEICEIEHWTMTQALTEAIKLLLAERKI